MYAQAGSVSCIPLAVRLCGKSCSDNCRQHVCAVCVCTSMALVHIVDGCKFSKALTSDIVLPLHGSFESAIRTTCATEDCKCNNGGITTCVQYVSDPT